MRTKFLILIQMFLFIFSSNVFASFANTYNYDEVEKDFKAQNVDKYLKDNLITFESNTLIEKNIINDKSQLTINSKKEDISCSFVNDNFTATIYNVDAKSGLVTCMLSKKGDLYNPIGIFETIYPNMKEFFKKDLEKAKTDNLNAVENSESQFSSLYTEKQTIFNSMNQQQNSDFMSVPDLLLSTILTDTNIIDVEATNTTNKLQLKQGFTSTIYNEDKMTDTSSQFILADAETIFANYTAISDISMSFLLLLVVLFFVIGAINVGFKKLVYVTKKKESESLMPYGFGVIAGLILFLPSSESLVIQNVNNQALMNDYQLHQNRFMDYERSGYYMMNNWSKDIAIAIIDNEIDSLIDKSGVGTAEQIVSSYASNEQYTKLQNYTQSIYDKCINDYNTKRMTSEKKDKNFHSNDINTVFPSSENYAYATSLVIAGTSSHYYNSVGNGGLINNSAYSQNVLNKNSNSLSNYYPERSISLCGKIYYENLKNQTMKKDMELIYSNAVNNSGNDNSNKLEAIRGIMTFQYKLYRDWGFLSILGLPIVKMQTETIGGLYSNPNDKIIDELNDKVDGGGVVGSLIHNVAASVPYMMIPGISNIYTHISKSYGDIIDGFDKSGWGKVKNFLGGGVITSTMKNITAFSSSYIIAKTVLIMLPIVGLLIIGLLRFIVIYIKILSFHFASLFLLPVMFAMNNLDAMKSFLIKILSTMLELPIFVLAVWLAMTANNMIHSVGDIFSKRIIIGMMENNESMHAIKTFEMADLISMNFEIIDTMKIYFLDGLMEVTISLASVFIIYKIIVNLHTAIFELIEIKGTATLDNTIDSMRSEMNSYGSRI